MSGRGGGGGRGYGGTRFSSLKAFDAHGEPGEAGRGGGRGGGRGRGYKKPLNSNFIQRGDGEENSNAKLLQQRADDELDAKFGFPLFNSGDDRLGWLMNIQPSVAEDKDTGKAVSSVDLYFMCQDGSMFKARVVFAPYFYVRVKEGREVEAEAYLRRKAEGVIKAAEVVDREDLSLKNHLSGLKRRLLKITTFTVQGLMEVRKEVAPLVAANASKAATTSAYNVAALQQQQQQDGAMDGATGAQRSDRLQDVREAFLELREFDVPYHVRYEIDTDVRCGHWYTVRARDGLTSVERRADLLQRGEPRICAFDIETTKLPLQFPNAEYDQVFMISYMIDRQGYLIVNREVVGADISDFEFTPKPEFEGPFKVFNEPDEAALLRRFFSHLREVKPAIVVTYNGDFFDFPFVDARAAVHGMDMHQEMGFRMKGGPGPGGGAAAASASKECLAKHAVHMDCMHWVDRDSYLPQGSRGLKAVCKAKLGYDPVEVHPEDMVRLARETPQAMASYSVSDAVATYYLYMTYVHPFIFSLATIIPMPPDEVLRKGSGTLCEQLLMVEAFRAGIACPNKHASEREAMYRGHLLESETYIGGKVEALESGVFRADLPLRFKCKPAAYQMLLDNLDRDLGYSLKHEAHWKGAADDCVNYQEVRAAIAAKLESLRDVPNREEVPLIYHLDVAAMYPNIILTNRLQPPAIVTEEDCAACDFNKPGKTCLRQMEWVWRGEHYSASRSEYLQIKAQVASETFPPAQPGERPRAFAELPQEEQAKLVIDRLKKYCQKVYKRVLDKPITEQRVAGVCQRENSFYIDTVRAFRDRRYEYKGLNKVWKGKLDDAKASGNPIRIQEAADMVVLYDSLQLAHKCILNSFYGYVMRKGARWYSMQMAGVVTYTGANIIQRANRLVLELGRTLELDTDGIWCALPGSFPEAFKFKNKSGKEFKLSYPCCVLNVMVAEHNTNHQYQTLVKEPGAAGPGKYVTSAEMSIEFEVDGPYKAMILPASKEEGKSIKKRYAVFNFDGSLAELKGFEVKRRGELKLIKVFQAEVFEQFLSGSTLEQCYAAVAAVANRWLDMLDTRGEDLTDGELLEYISEATTMSKGLDEYEGRKSCPITTAQRMAAFLGDERLKDKGLATTYVIAKSPANAPTSERAVPVSIFSAEPAVARAWLRRWCGGEIGPCPNGVPDVRDIVDWNYYRERLGSAIQKIITIPAAMQGVGNPVPRVKHPDWLHKKVRERTDKCQQLKLDDMMARMRQQQQAAKDADAQAAAAAGRQGGAPDSDGEDADMPDDTGPGPADGAGAGGATPGKAAAAAAGSALVDLEDIASGQGGGAAARRSAGAGAGPVVARARTLERGAGGDKENAPPAAGQQQQQPEQGVPAPPPPASLLAEDYRAWVAGQKSRWRSLRQDNKRRRLDAAKAAEQARRAGGAAAGAAGGLTGGGMRSLLAQQQAALTALPWQVLQLAETQVPGHFRVWCLAQGRLHSLTLEVPRTLYIDCTVPPDHLQRLLDEAAAAGGGGGRLGASQAAVASLLGGSGAQAVQRTLPGGRKPHCLYRVVLTEAEYLSRAPALAAALSSTPQVLGVYEERMPLALEASLQLGCVVSAAPGARSKPLGAVWQLADLQMRSSAECGYLEQYDKAAGATGSRGSGAAAAVPEQQQQAAEPLGPSLRPLVLYHSADPLGRGVYVLVMPAAGRGLAVVVHSAAGAAREVAPALVERLWRDAAAAGQQDGGVAFGADKLSWEVAYERADLDAARTLQRALMAYRSGNRGTASVVVVQGPGPGCAGRLAKDIQVLADFPTLDMPYHEDDSKYPALQWQQRAVRRGLARAAGAAVWLAERAALCRYAHMPLANLQGDPALAVADALMARRLRDAGTLLPVVDPTLPDLGVEPHGQGADDADDARLEASSSRPRSELAFPGAYRSVCVTLRLQHLAVAALEAADALAELEGSAALGAGAGGAGPGGGAGGSFKVLRALQAAWIKDATQNHNAIADGLLRNLYRWVSHPGSALHDPALHALLLGLQHKLFLQLCAEMRRLGAVIVSANLNTITLATGKSSVRAAVGYTRFLLDALAGRELFKWLSLSPGAWYHAHLYRDAYNWAGLESAAAQALWAAGAAAAGGDDADGEDGAAAAAAAADASAEEEPVVKFVWNLKEYLPPAVQGDLVLIMTEFLFLPWREARRAVKQAREAAAGGGATAREEGGGAAGAAPGASQGGSQAVVEANRLEGVQSEFLKRLVNQVFTERLLSRVATWGAMPLQGDHPDWAFPQLPGSYLTLDELGHPALAFTRVVCALLALDARVADDVGILRKQLLRLQHVREFSAAADFRELCQPFTLHDVICSVCADCRDLDLCRDEALAQHDWRCRNCRQPHDKAAIERRLLALLRAEAAGYQVQDLCCTRCKQVASGHLRGLCNLCGGGLANTRTPAAAARRLTVYHSIARFHAMEVLREASAWLMGAGHAATPQEGQGQQ